MDLFEDGNIKSKPNGTNGWILGNFPDKLNNTLFFTKDFEVKWSLWEDTWKIPKDKTSKGVTAHKTARTISILISGKLKIDLPDLGKSKILEKEGDYFAFGPNVFHSWVALDDSCVVTFRWPSDPANVISRHEMRLHPQPFGRIQAGAQVIESRLNDEKRQEIKVGDHVIFALRPDFVEKLEVEVTELIHAPTFRDLFASRPVAEFGVASIEDAEGMYEYYSKEDEAKYGVLGIKFKVL